MKSIFRHSMIIAAIFLFSISVTGCGSGGNSTASRNTKAKTSVKTAGLLAGQTLGAIQLTISIPYGVTVALDPTTQEPTRDVVQLIGAADKTMVFQAVNYIKAQPAVPGSLTFMIVNASGFGALEYVAIQLDITEGFFPKKEDFNITNFAVADIVNYQLTQITNFTATVEII